MVGFVLRLALFARTIVRLWRRDPNFRTLVILVIFTLLSGTIFYSLQEGWSLVDAFYFSATTLTTVGLGDLAPTTTIAKLFTVVYVFSGLVQRTRPHRRLHRYDSEGGFEQEDGEAEGRGSFLGR